MMIGDEIKAAKEEARRGRGGVGVGEGRWAECSSVVMFVYSWPLHIWM